MNGLVLKVFGLGLCVAAAAAALPSCSGDSYWTRISGPVVIEGEWLELRPESPLKAEKTFQWVAIELEPPFKDDLNREGSGPESGRGILTPEGETINPRVEVLDQHGNSFALVNMGSSRGRPVYGYDQSGKLPSDREYTVVRLRSAKPIKSKAIYWYCESSKDWK
jgi:hypothetical protein